MKAIFVETRAFTANLDHHLTDDEYQQLQKDLLYTLELGDVMPRTGGFRKLRWRSMVVNSGCLPIYDKDEPENLTSSKRNN